jgi:hypothetical protein
MKRVLLLLCPLLFAISVNAEIEDHANRGLGQAQCRCEAPGEHLYNRRLDQETAVFDDDDDDNANDNRNRQLPFLSSSPYYVINGVRVLPSSNAACQSNRNMEESNEEDKEDIFTELEEMDENESITLEPDEMRKLKGDKGKGDKGKGSKGKGSKGSKGKGSKGSKSVSRVEND